MGYYPDGSAYEYLPRQPPMINIGWLGVGHPFTTGPVPEDGIATLFLLATEKHNIMRGVQDCEFCDEESPLRLPADTPRGYVSLGMGEFHVEAADGTIFSAPSLVLHYIIAHKYQPPTEFIDAVRRSQPA